MYLFKHERIRNQRCENANSIISPWNEIYFISSYLWAFGGGTGGGGGLYLTHIYDSHLGQNSLTFNRLITMNQAMF